MNLFLFSDVYRSVNYIGSLAKGVQVSFASDPMSLYFDKPQENEIHQ